MAKLVTNERAIELLKMGAYMHENGRIEHWTDQYGIAYIFKHQVEELKSICVPAHTDRYGQFYKIKE